MRAPTTCAACAVALALAVQLGGIAARPAGGAAIGAADVRRAAPWLDGRVARLQLRPDGRGRGTRAELPPGWAAWLANESNLRRLLLFVDGSLVPVMAGEPDEAGPLPQAFVRSRRAGAVFVRCGGEGCGEVLAARADVWFKLVAPLYRLAERPATAVAVLVLAVLWGAAVWRRARRWPGWTAAAVTVIASGLTAGWLHWDVSGRPWAISWVVAEATALALVLVAGGTASRARAQGRGSVPAWAPRLLLLLMTGALGLLALARAVQDGVCCGDDALFAVAAKDLARGHGYPEGGGRRGEDAYFGLSDGRVTVGPILVLPVAAAIAALGNRHWVPGGVSIVLWLGLFALVATALRPFGDPRRRDLALAVFLALSFALCVWHFEHWFAMLGEVPACLLVWLAVAVWARRPRRRRSLAMGSLVLGLACLTKLVMVLCVPPLLAGVAMARGVRRPHWRQALSDVAVSLFCLALPVALFQCFRLATAGWDGYVEETRSWIAFTLKQGTAEPEVALTARLADLTGQAYQSFGAGPLELLLLSTLSLVIVTRRCRPHLRLMVAVLLGCVLTNAAWWLCFSKGWPRYLIIAIILAAAAAALAPFALRARLPALGYALAVATCTLPAWPRLADPLRRPADGWFAPSAPMRNAMAVAARIDATPARLRFYGPGWPAMSDLEYLSADVGRLRRFPEGFSSTGDTPFAIAFNTSLVFGPIPEFDRRLAACRRDEDERPPYTLAWCGPLLPTPGGER